MLQRVACSMMLGAMDLYGVELLAQAAATVMSGAKPHAVFACETASCWR
jgi:hypothetical protein